MSFSPSQVRDEFPLLEKNFKDKPLCYLDSAASSLKPKSVIAELDKLYSGYTANVHRGAHILSDQATELYEGARANIARKLSASSQNEVIFTKGTTDSVNLVAQSFVKSFMKAGEKILLTEMEHHSNIVPWQMAAETAGVEVDVVKVTDEGVLDLEDLKSKLTSQVKILSMVHCSNVLGTVNPVSEVAKLCKAVGAKLFVDAAQSVTFMNLDVTELGCDFLCFSSHKVFGPFGVGVLWGKEELLNDLTPYQGGGSMISKVSFSGTTFLKAPHRFEAGTPHVAGAVGLSKAMDWLYQFSLEEVHHHEAELVQSARNRLEALGGISFYGPKDQPSNILSFNLDGAHPSDVGQILDEQNVAVRAGHHCCQPLMERYKIPGTVRASFSIFNDQSDVDNLVHGVEKAKELLL